MPDDPDGLHEIMTQRMMLVGEIAKLNAEQLRNTQMMSGNQIELMRCAQSPNEEAQSELADAKVRDAQLRDKITQCENKLKTLEEEIAAIDSRLATL